MIGWFFAYQYGKHSRRRQRRRDSAKPWTKRDMAIHRMLFGLFVILALIVVVSSLNS